jgi:hypothetical protein
MATPTTLPATFVAGDVLTAAQMNNLRGAFRILQVINATVGTQAISSSATYADTGLTASITPSATSSKVLILVQQNGVLKNTGAAGNACSLRLVRGSTTINEILEIGKTNTDLLNIIGSVPFIYLDNPATTSSTTYKTQFASHLGGTNGAYVQYLSQTSSITLFEVSL